MPQTILYVDDDEDIRTTAEVFLRKQGYSLITAADAPSALRVCLAPPPPDLVITDIVMPGESGYTLCEKLRANPGTRHIPIIVATILDEEGKAIDAGASAFLGKPFLGRQLIETIQAVLPESGPNATILAAIAELRAKNIAGAAASFGMVVRAQPHSPSATWARYYLARIHEMEGKPDLALEELRALLAASPDFWRAHTRRGDLFRRKGDREAALSHYRRSLAICPAQPDTEAKVGELERKD